MRFKFTKELCYIAGLASRTHEPERSQVGIMTSNDELMERFIKYAMKLGVDSKKIMIEEQDTTKHIYFYHSKLARIIQEVLKQRSALPKKGRELAVAFIAGTFDAGGHMMRDKITIKRLDKGDELLLELMGIHTVNSKILNIGDFFRLIKGHSIIAESATF